MEKFKVNNFIVGMRKSVAQARLHIINKLVRESRKLKEKKGTDQQKEKNARRAERFVQEVSEIKKIHKDEFSKYALLNKEEVPKILNNMSIPLEERVKARLSAHESITKKVSEFRTKYPDWEMKLPVVLTQLGLKYRKQKSKKVNENFNINVKKKSDSDITVGGLNKKSQAKTSQKNVNCQIKNSSVIKKVSDTSNIADDTEIDESEEHTESGNEDICLEDNTGEILDSNDVRNMNTELVVVEDKDEKGRSQKFRFHKSPKDNSEISNISGSESEKKRVIRVKKEKKGRSEVKEKVKVEIKNSGVSEIRKFSDLVEDLTHSLQSNEPESQNDCFSSMSSTNEAKQTSKLNWKRTEDVNNEFTSEIHDNDGIKDHNKVKKSRDSFFLTGDDSDTGSKNETQTNNFETRNLNKEKKFLKSSQDKQSKSEKSHVLEDFSNGKRNVNRGGFNEIPDTKGSSYMTDTQKKLLNISSSKSQIENYSTNGGGSGFSVPLNRRQRRLLERTKSLSTVQGTELMKHNISKPHLNVSTLNKKQRQIIDPSPIGGTNEGNLHPSWEAKRKQKLQIIPFEGKKIKFDD